MSQILLVENDRSLAESLKQSLEGRSYTVHWAQNLATAKKVMSLSEPEILLLDWTLPDGSGFDFGMELRKRNTEIPIIFLMTKIDESIAIKGLSIGNSDFMRKPFGVEELVLRIKKSLKESLESSEEIRFGDLRILRKSWDVYWKESKIKVNRKEFQILELLMRKAGNVVSREDILGVIDSEGEIIDRTVDSHVSHLRRKFKDAGVKEIAISSAFGVGYRLEKIK